MANPETLSERNLSEEIKQEVWVETRLNVDKSVWHLEGLIHRYDKSYEGLMNWDSKTTILAIQVLLKDRWYDVGKFDGFLKSVWNKSSKTMEAIKKFQKDNWIEPVDWVPWLMTIKGLLSYYWYHPINSQHDVRALADKKTVQDVEIKWVITYYKRVKEWLGRDNSMIDLNWITSITDKKAELLTKIKRANLNWLTKITDNQTKILSNMEYLWLNWLKNITDNQAENLWNLRDLWLTWLISITDKQAEGLAKVERLHINEDILTPTQKKILKNRIK